MSYFYFYEMRSEKELSEWIRTLIETNELWRFYKSKEWINLKRQVLRENHYECAECKRQGKLTRYDIDKCGRLKLISTVHHAKHVRQYPELAMSRTFSYKGKIYNNLIPVCKACHNRLHPEKQRKNKIDNDKFTNVERW